MKGLEPSASSVTGNGAPVVSESATTVAPTPSAACTNACTSEGENHNADPHRPRPGGPDRRLADAAQGHHSGHHGAGASICRGWPSRLGIASDSGVLAPFVLNAVCLTDRDIVAAGIAFIRDVGPRGVELTADSESRTPVSDNMGARGGAIEGATDPIDTDLAALIDAWPALPRAVQQAIVLLVKGLKQ